MSRTSATSHARSPAGRHRPCARRWPRLRWPPAAPRRRCRERSSAPRAIPGDRRRSPRRRPTSTGCGRPGSGTLQDQLQLGLGGAHARGAAGLVVLRHDGRARGPRTGRASSPCWSAALPSRPTAAPTRRSPPPARASFRRFVRDVVRRYGRGGSFWQLPPRRAAAPDPRLPGLERAELPAALVRRAVGARVTYASLLKLIGRTIRANDRSATIGTAGLLANSTRGPAGYRYLDDLYARQGHQALLRRRGHPSVLRGRPRA